jgi:hypothetical protein
MTRPRRHPARRLAGVIVGALLAALFAVPAAWASTPFTDIHSAGPLSDIYIGNDLSCQVRDGGFSSTEFFPNAAGPGDCGTFVNTGSDNNTSQLEGPDFANHPGGTNTTGNFTLPEVPFTPVSQTLTGSGTAASPHKVTTVVTSSDQELNSPPIIYELTEVDSYIVGNDFYRTDVTIKNIGSGSTPALQTLYHAADCQLRGSDNGFGVDEPLFGAAVTGVACTISSSSDAVREQLVPITPAGANGTTTFTETTVPLIWNNLASSTFPAPTCCTSNTDNATGIGWTFDGLAPGASQTFSWNTVISDTVPAGGFSFSGAAGSAVGGTVATVTDPNTSATASAYTATINWGDGASSAGTISGGNGSFSVTGNHAYAAGGQFPIAVTITSTGDHLGSSTVSDSATISAPPTTVLTAQPPTVSATGAAFSGSANPNGLPTTAVFQYGLDLKYTTPGASGPSYTQSTPAQFVGSDFASHIVSTSVSGLVPNALYHVRLVVKNSDGTTFGPDVTFTTGAGPKPGSPTPGKTFNVSLVSGLVLVEINGQLVPLTELTQIPKNTLIDALQGTIQLTTALPGASSARDAAAKGKKHKTKTQTGTFGGAIFKISQATRGAGKGLVTLAIVENAFTGAPSYSLCTKHTAGDPTATVASSRTLQLLRASAHGKFRTSGHYSAATVLGTKWTVADRCDGTLTHDITDSVVVNDFVHHKTIVLHAGQSYLAKAPKHK